MDRRGLVIVHTGDGKGKTTAALGLAVRAFGAGLKVLILQFIKGARRSGELTALEILGVEVRQLGLGFITPENFVEQKKSARAALELARTEILSGAWDLIVLDEINYAVKFGLLDTAEILSLIKARDAVAMSENDTGFSHERLERIQQAETSRCRPPQMHLVFTGRDAPLELIDAADLVTEMKLVKHPFKQGVKAQIGIEF